MMHRRTPLLALALGAGLLLSGAPAASAAPAGPVQGERVHEASSDRRDTGGRHDANKALEKLRKDVLATVDRADRDVVRVTSKSSTAALTAAHRETLGRAVATLRADLAALRSTAASATTASALQGVSRAVPKHAAGHLEAVVKVVATADRAITRSVGTQAELAAALDAATAEGKDTQALQGDADDLAVLAGATRAKVAGEADAALATAGTLADKKLVRADKAVKKTINALKALTDAAQELTEAVEALPVPAPVEPTPTEPTPTEPTPTEPTPTEPTPTEPTPTEPTPTQPTPTEPTPPGTV